MREYPFAKKEDAKVKLISTDWLEKNLDRNDLMILDTQPDIHDYISEHIPGSFYFNQKLFRVPFKGRPGMYIPSTAVEELFRRVGLKSDVPVVVYTGKGIFRGWGDGLEQTMLAYSLARFGHDNIYVLDGGLDKWKEEGKKITKEFPAIKESDFNVNVRDNYFISMAEVKQLKDQPDVMLLDARPKKVYQGQGPWMKPGHIPGAINLPWKDLMNEQNPTLLKSDEEINKILEEKNIGPDNTIICSCGTGREATNEFLLFKWYLGYPNVMLYEGSFTEWSSYPSNDTVLGEHPNLAPQQVTG